MSASDLDSGDNARVKICLKVFNVNVHCFPSLKHRLAVNGTVVVTKMKAY